MSDCLTGVSVAFGLSQAQITGAGRQWRISRARHCFCWLASVATTAARKEISHCVNRSRDQVDYGVDFVNRRAGAAELRERVLDRLRRGEPDTAELLEFGRRLERITREG